MPAKEDNFFGIYLRTKLEQAGMSMRKLAQTCGVDPSTISRIIKGSQKPRPEHLVRIAPVLKLTVLELWQAAGYIQNEQLPEEPAERMTTSPCSFDTVKVSVSQTGVNFDAYTLSHIEGLNPARIRDELEKYRIYAQTTEGQETIMQNFSKKLDQIKGAGPFINKLQVMYKLYLSEETDQEIKYIIGSVLLYFISPIDIIPDYLAPIGYLDDAMATDLVWLEIQDLLAK